VRHRRTGDRGGTTAKLPIFHAFPPHAECLASQVEQRLGKAAVTAAQLGHGVDREMIQGRGAPQFSHLALSLFLVWQNLHDQTALGGFRRAGGRSGGTYPTTGTCRT
jgi:hypothetical protein